MRDQLLLSTYNGMEGWFVILMIDGMWNKCVIAMRNNILKSRGKFLYSMDVVTSEAVMEVVNGILEVKVGIQAE
eukprot:scaffold89765_cov73-Attheya_sp.AAC.1